MADPRRRPSASRITPRSALSLAAAVALWALAQGCGLGDARDLLHQRGRVDRIGSAVGAQACHVSQALLDERDRDAIRQHQDGRREAAKTPSCIQSSQLGRRVPLMFVNGKVRCPVHGAPGEGPAPLDTVQAEIHEGTEGPVPGVDFGEYAMAAYLTGGCFLLAAGYWYLKGGADSDLRDALRRTALGKVGELTPGYRCVTGKVAVETPLLVPRARTPAAAFRYQQIEEWEERREDGSWETCSKLLKDEREGMGFDLEDGTGAVPVLLKGARFEGRKLHHEVVPAGGVDGMPTGLDPKASQVGGSTQPTPGLGPAQRTRNRRFVHQVTGLAPGDVAVVIGTAEARDGGPLAFHAGPGRDEELEPFFVGAGTPEELVRRIGEDATMGRMLMFAFAGLALACFVTGLALQELGG